MKRFEEKFSLWYTSLMSKKKKTTPLGFIRILFGFLFLYLFSSLFFVRDVILGPDKFTNFYYFPGEGKIWITLSELFNSYLFTDIFLIVGMILSLFYIFGFQIKITTILLFFSFQIMEYRNDLAFNSGEDFLKMSLLYFLFCDNSKFSIDAYLKEKRKKKKQGKTNIAPFNQWSTIIHNYAVFSIILQFSFIYFFAGLSKALDSYWQDGTMMYYLMQIDYFNTISFVSDIVISHAWIYTPFTYFAIFFQLTFPIFVLWKRTRLLFLFFALCFHLFVIFHFAVVTFAVVMLFFEIIYFSDEEYQWAKEKILERKRKNN